MSKSKILLQFDSDQHASVFDAVTAVDAGVDQLLQYASVDPAQVRDLVYGAMFTRGSDELHNTAVFIGGSNVAAGEVLLEKTIECFFGPIRVSVLLDANGANTTASAAVLSAAKHVDLQGTQALVLAATGPVGQRAVRLLARQGARVRVASRKKDRSEHVCFNISQKLSEASITPWQVSSPDELAEAMEGVQVVFAAGAAGVELLPEEFRRKYRDLKVAIDLNAVPPLGITGVEVTDKAKERDGVVCYGAIGVGGLKMKIHKAAIGELFKVNDRILDADEIYEIGSRL